VPVVQKEIFGKVIEGEFMFVHEYSDKHFATYEECVEDLSPEIEIEDIAQHIDLTVSEILYEFSKRLPEDFIEWLQEKMESAHSYALDELITEYEEGEVD
jgi:hypothetical protein